VEAYSSYWYTYSDISLKKDIFKIDEYINDKIDMLEPVFYTLKSNDKKDVGFIAQEVQKVFPLLVSKAMDGLLTIDYSKLTPYLVKGAQENNNKIKELEKKLDEEKDKREKMEEFFKEEIEKLRKEILRK
jgi:flagellar capping protein FliD